MKGRVRPTTHEGYESLIRLHARPALGAVPLKELTSLDIQHLYSSLLSGGSLSSGTVLNTHLVLTQALGQAVRWGLLTVNPAVGAQPPRPRRPEPYPVDPELLQRLLTAAEGTRAELPAAIAASTGMRRGEILGLRWSDADHELSVVHVRRSLQPTSKGPIILDPKTRRARRTVELPRFLTSRLLRQREDQARRRCELGEAWTELGLIVDRGDGGSIHPYALSSAWRRVIRKHGFPPVRFHDLRHAHATLMLLQGVHPKVVSERLGHANIGITLDIYSHVLPSMQSEAVQAFDDLFST
jgi:integrase